MSTTAPDAHASQAERDAAHLASLGYRQELHRRLGFFSNFAVAFSYISVTTGIFALFALGIGTGGPAFIWSWPIVALGQFLVALVFAELASHYPIAGSIYQWSKRVASPTSGWFIGWLYLGATILTISSVALTLPITLTSIFNWPTDSGTFVKIAVATLAVTTLINVAGVRLVSFINNIGVFAEIIGMVVFAVILILIGHHQPLGVFVNTAGTEHTPGAGAGYLGVFAAAMFMSLYVIYGFDTAGSLGEETVNPSRQAPRGVLWSIGISFFAGGLFLAAALIAIKSVPATIQTANGSNSYSTLPNIITGSFGSFWGNIYLGVVSIAIFVCTLSIQAAGMRLMFSMGRDGRLPFSRVWATVNPTLGTPMWAGLAVGVLAGLPFFASAQISVVAAGATGLIYLSYFVTNLVVLQARLRGWPERKAWFNLGRWAMPVNVLALVYGGAMLVNFAWFRPATNPTLGSAFSGAANWPLIGGSPMFELSIALLLIVGGIYWFAVQRHKLEATPTATSSLDETGMRPAR